MNTIPEHDNRLVKGLPGGVSQHDPNRLFTQYIRYQMGVVKVREEAAARGVHIVLDETLPERYMIVEVPDG
jgi:hypothetical protein